jgi:carbon-monoxide dehydrogenase small subunit
MVMATYALLSDKPNPSDQEIKEGLDGNLCRCTGYAKIIQAVKLAAEEMRRDG